jgi:aminomethyltransferase
MATALAQTPLHDWHAAHGGRMVDFAGWSMPVQYTSIVAEHMATRNAATLFDISHMGRLRFDGPGAAAFLDSLVTRRVADQKLGQIRYALVTNDSGGILDDVLVYHLADVGGNSYWLMVVNASNRAKIVDFVEPRVAEALAVTMADVTFDWSMIAVQGPRAIELLQPLTELPINDLKYYHGAETRIAGHGGIVSRTGYTGEDGCELILGARAVAGVWQSLVDAGAMPAGLGARDTLRLEAGMPLYGHELNESIDPLEAGLGFAVNLAGRSFSGSEALKRLAEQTARPRRVGLTLAGKRVPREGYSILAGSAIASGAPVESTPVGTVTSGTFSPTLDCPIAMGYVAPASAAVGTELAIDIRGRAEPARVVELPFYRRNTKGIRT